MMFGDYIRQRRKVMFPHITNWKDPQNKYRNEKDVTKLEFYEWFFLHPSAYKLMHYGIPSIAITIFAIIATILIKTQHYLLTTITAFITLFIITILIQRIKEYKNIKLTKITHYDLWMKD